MPKLAVYEILRVYVYTVEHTNGKLQVKKMKKSFFVKYCRVLYSISIALFDEVVSVGWWITLRWQLSIFTDLNTAQLTNIFFTAPKLNDKETKKKIKEK